MFEEVKPRVMTEDEHARLTTAVIGACIDLISRGISPDAVTRVAIRAIHAAESVVRNARLDESIVFVPRPR